MTKSVAERILKSNFLALYALSEMDTPEGRAAENKLYEALRVSETRLEDWLHRSGSKNVEFSLALHGEIQRQIGICIIKGVVGDIDTYTRGSKRTILYYKCTPLENARIHARFLHFIPIANKEWKEIQIAFMFAFVEKNEIYPLQKEHQAARKDKERGKSIAVDPSAMQAMRQTVGDNRLFDELNGTLTLEDGSQ